MEIDILSSENVAVVRTVFSICGKVAVALLAVLCVIAWAAAIYDAVVGWRSRRRTRIANWWGLDLRAGRLFKKR